MSSFSRFQDINQKRGIANKQTNASFVLKGYPTISIQGPSGEELTASVVNRQEKDSAYIFTNTSDLLKIGSVWSAKGLHWLIFEEIISIKDVNWRKYAAILCNVEINGSWGYFLSPERSYINVALKEDVVLQSQQKPVLVLGQDVLNINDKFMVKDRAWMVQEKDNFDLNGITYYSLVATTISKNISKTRTNDSTIVLENNKDNFEIPKVVEKTKFLPNRKIVFETQKGYFKCDQKVKVHSLTEKEVIFSIPNGIKECIIQVQENYKIVYYTLEREE